VEGLMRLDTRRLGWVRLLSFSDLGLNFGI
jgi:hypothetical protein